MPLAPAPMLKLDQSIFPRAPLYAQAESVRATVETSGLKWATVYRMVEPLGYDITTGPNNTIGRNRRGKETEPLPILLPVGSHIEYVAYFHLSRGDGFWHWNTENFDLMWMIMEPAMYEVLADGVHVTGVAVNFSPDQNMECEMGVAYRAG